MSQRGSAEFSHWGGLLDWGLIVLFVARFLVVLPIVSNPGAAHFPDSQGYLQLALSIVTGAGFQTPSESPIDLLRPPAYPALLAPIVNFTRTPEPAVAAIQILLSGVAAVLVYWISARLWSQTAGRSAAALVLLSPNLILWSLAILSDILFAVLLVGAAVLLAVALQSERVWWLLASGALAGLAVLARPIGLTLLIPWAFIAAWGMSRGRAGWRAAAAGGLFVIGASVVVLPWSYRNYVKWGYFHVSSIGMRNLSRYMAAPTIARAQGLTLEEARRRVPSNLVPLHGEFRRGIRVLMSYPETYLELHARGTYRTLAGPGRSNLAKLAGMSNPDLAILRAAQEGGIGAWLVALGSALSDPARRALVVVPPLTVTHLIVLYGASSAAVFATSRMTGLQRTMLLLATFTAMVLVFLPGPVGNSRFRVPAEPFLALAAGAGIDWTVKRLPTRRHSSAVQGGNRPPDADVGIHVHSVSSRGADSQARSHPTGPGKADRHTPAQSDVLFPIGGARSPDSRLIGMECR